MSEIIVFNSTAQGESHKATGKVCQDASLCVSDAEDNIHFGVVSDGHGSSTYFRSNIGSEILIEITREKVFEFINQIELENIVETNFQQIPIRKEVDKKQFIHDELFRGLFASIISCWNEKIMNHWLENKPTNEEMRRHKVPESAILKYENSEGIEVAYGCTLLSFIRTDKFWFAFHLGDGTCITFDEDGSWTEPIPADEKCIGNITTSMCEEDALDNFRYCIGTNTFPLAIFIASDGLDGAYGNISDLALLYNGIIKSFVTKGDELTINDIKESLPVLSTKGISRDDMSLAGLVDKKECKTIYSALLQNDFKYQTHYKQKKEEVLAEKEADFSNNEKEIIRMKKRQKELVREIKVDKNKSNTLNILILKLEKELESARHDKQKTDDAIKQKKDENEKLQNELKTPEDFSNRIKTAINLLKDEINNISFKIEKISIQMINFINKD